MKTTPATARSTSMHRPISWDAPVKKASLAQFSKSTMHSYAESSQFKSLGSAFIHWIKKIFFCFFSSDKVEPDVKKPLTALELEARIQKGRDWINKSIKSNLGNSTRNLNRDKVLVAMLYNDKTVISFPTTHPVDLEQLKKDAAFKLETMMRQSPNPEQTDPYLRVSTYFFTRLVRKTDGAITPYIWYGTESHSRDFRVDRDSYSTHGEKIEDADLRTWLNNFVPPSVPERQAIINYASGALNW